VGNPRTENCPAIFIFSSSASSFVSENSSLLYSATTLLRIVQPKNKLIWWLALNVVILNIRPVKSAQNYVKIWDSFGKGSPLLNITLLQAQGVEKILTNKFDDLALEMGMRYGNPSIDSASLSCRLSASVSNTLVLTQCS
jgi:protoheme ferro-lyase